MFSHSVLTVCTIGILGNVSALRRQSYGASEILSKDKAGLSGRSVSDIPYLKKQANATQLVADGKPFLILGGELHNSSTSNLGYLEPIWPRLVQMNLKTFAFF
jgi:hypothetical protein